MPLAASCTKENRKKKLKLKKKRKTELLVALKILWAEENHYRHIVTLKNLFNI
jgi:hypothetical protein